MFIGNLPKVNDLKTTLDAALDQYADLKAGENFHIRYRLRQHGSESMGESTATGGDLLQEAALKATQVSIDCIRSELQALGVTLDGEAEEAAE